MGGDLPRPGERHRLRCLRIFGGGGAGKGLLERIRPLRILHRRGRLGERKQELTCRWPSRTYSHFRQRGLPRHLFAAGRVAASLRFNGFVRYRNTIQRVQTSPGLLSIFGSCLLLRDANALHSPVRMYGKGYGGWGGGKGWGDKGWGGKGYGYGYPPFGPWDGGKGMMMGAYGGMMMPPMFGFKGKGKGKGKSPLKVDPAKKVWIGNIPEGTQWKELQTLVDEVAKSKWVEIFRGKGKGTAAVVYATPEEASQAVSALNGLTLGGQSIVVDSWEKGTN
eukprot:s2293_g3.t1